MPNFSLGSAKAVLGFRNLIRAPGTTVSVTSGTVSTLDNLLYPDFDEVTDFGGSTNYEVVFQLPAEPSWGPRLFVLWLSSGAANPYSLGPRIRTDNNSSFTSPTVDAYMQPFFPSGYPSHDPMLLTRPFFMHIDTAASAPAGEDHIGITFDWTVWNADVHAVNFYAGPYLQAGTPQAGPFVIPNEGGIGYGYADESILTYGPNGSDSSFGRQLRRNVDLSMKAMAEGVFEESIWRELMLASGAAHDVVFCGYPEDGDAGKVHDFTWLGHVRNPRKLSPFSGSYWEGQLTIEERL